MILPLTKRRHLANEVTLLLFGHVGQDCQVLGASGEDLEAVQEDVKQWVVPQATGI